MVIGLQVASAIAAVLAAFLWFRSARVTTPSSFSIHVAKLDFSPPLGMLGAEYVGHGYGQDLTELGNALTVQSRFSGYAAIAAAISAILQAISLILPWFLL